MHPTGCILVSFLFFYRNLRENEKDSHCTGPGQGPGTMDSYIMPRTVHTTVRLGTEQKMGTGSVDKPLAGEGGMRITCVSPPPPMRQWEQWE